MSPSGKELQNISIGEITIDQAIAAWVDAKRGKSGSEKTRKAYEETVESFRRALAQFTLDLNSDLRQVALIVQGWARTREPGANREDEVSNATYNQRLAILSSFYSYVRRHQLLPVENPIDLVERRTVQAYQGARPMEDEEVRKCLSRIDRSTLAGKRDYALLSIAFHTGRRAGELAGLRWKHVSLTGKKVIIRWPPTKGGKEMSDELGVALSKALLEYIYAVYGKEIGQLPGEATIWIACTNNTEYRGEAIGMRAIADIYKRRLGVSKIHTSRHTFAHEMEKVGATVSEIAGRLGHSSVATTTKYLNVMNAPQNRHMGRLEQVFGLADNEEE